MHGLKDISAARRYSTTNYIDLFEYDNVKESHILFESKNYVIVDT
jgi:hypothetical protein